MALFFVIAVYAAYAFASSETGQIPAGGEAASPISGWTVSNVHYQLAEDASRIAAVEFDLDASAKTVQVSLDSSKALFFSCANLSQTHWICHVGSQVSVAAANEFRVVAAGN
jgi:hypothetical protein